MGEMLAQLQNAWRNLTRQQKLMIGGLTGILFVGMLGAVILGGSTDYVMLASDLEALEAQKIAAKLAEAGIAYKIASSGDALTVDVARREEARQVLLAEGLTLTGQGGPGYSAIGEGGISMTEDQRKEWMRVLQEQEIARTIRVYNKNVRKAKVHVTPPVHRSFRRGDEPAKAAVTIANEPGTWLDAAQVEAIQVMVASAVKGLEPKRVAVIDSSGRNLAADPALKGEADAFSVSKRRREQDLERKLGSALAVVLGGNDAIVRVSLSLDRERIESTDRTIDKGSKALSREKVESTENTRPGPRGSPSPESAARRRTSGADGKSKTEKVESDFEYSTKTVHRIKEAGAIRRMTVAVFVNSNPGDTELNRESLRSELEETARATVGFDESRGDTLALKLVPFRIPPAEPAPPEPGVLDHPRMLMWVQWGVAALLGLVVLFWFMRSARKAKAGLREALENSRREQAQREARQDAQPGDGTHEDPSQDIAAVIQSNPEAVGRLLRNWMYETVK